MEPIRIGQRLDGTPIHLNLKDLIHLLFTASTGFGKTTALRLILERTHGVLPHLVVDCEGELSTLRQEYDYVLLGPNGDLPLDPRAASLLPRRIMEHGFSAIVDLSEAKPGFRHEYVRGLYDGLLELPRELWNDYLLIHDEAHRDLPEGGKRGERPACADAIADGFSLFRKRGGHILAATQRLAKFDKDGAAECEAKIVGRCNLSDDQERALKELGERSNKEMGVLIGRLAPGQVIILGRAFGAERPTVVQLDKPKTNAPPRGKGTVAPAARATVLKVLEQLRDLPQEADKKLKTEADLRAEVTHLRRELTVAKRGVPVQQVTRTEVKTIDRPVVSKHAVTEAAKATLKVRTEVDRAARGLRDVLDRADTTIQRLERDLAKVQNGAASPQLKARGQPGDVNYYRPGPIEVTIEGGRATHSPVMETIGEAAGRDLAASINADMAGLTGGQQRIVNTLATLSARGIQQPDRECLARWQGIHPNGGRFLDDLRTLRQRGFVHLDRLELTQDGILFSRAGETNFTAALQAIKDGTTRRILEAIHAAGQFETREALAGHMRLHPNGGRFLEGIRWLRQMRLIPHRGRFELTPEATT